MLGLLQINPILFLVGLLGLIISITIHEFAHAWMADHLGDPTPRMQGRLTLNPLAHLDPIGTITLILFRIGWGKPVQFDPYNLKNPQTEGAMIALAGPVSNLILAGILSLIIHSHAAPLWLVCVLTDVALINIGLAIFNLIPVHPLDGSKILLALLPRGLMEEYNGLMQRYGIFVLLILIFPWYNGQAPIDFILLPALSVVTKLFGLMGALAACGM